MTINGRYLALTLLAALLPATGRAQPAVSAVGSATQKLVFKAKDAPGTVTWETKEGLEEGEYPDGQDLGGIDIETGYRIRVAVKPSPETITGNPQDGFVLRDSDNPAHEVRFNINDGSRSDARGWQDGWLYLGYSARDESGGVALFLLHGAQTLYAGHYPLALEVGTWTP